MTTRKPPTQRPAMPQTAPTWAKTSSLMVWRVVLALSLATLLGALVWLTSLKAAMSAVALGGIGGLIGFSFGVVIVETRKRLKVKRQKLTEAELTEVNYLLVEQPLPMEVRFFMLGCDGGTTMAEFREWLNTKGRQYFEAKG